MACSSNEITMTKRMSKEVKVLRTNLVSSLHETLTHDLLLLIEKFDTETFEMQNFIYFDYINISVMMYAIAVDTEHKLAYQ